MRTKISCLNSSAQIIALLMISIILTGCGTTTDSADLVLLNGKIVTMDEATPQAQAIAAKDGKILAVGTDDEIKKFIDANTRVIDLKGKLAVPGLIEGHAHFLGLGNALTKLRLAKAQNFGEIIAMVAEKVTASQPGEWILGRGWHQEKWDAAPEPNVDGLPLHNALSAISPDNPVMLTHASGHATMANAKAMKLAGVTSETPDPEGGQIVRDKNGQPIGVFRENAEELIYNAYLTSKAEMTEEQIETQRLKTIELAIAECLENGITSFCDAGSTFDQIETYKKLADAGELGVRLWLMLGEDNDALIGQLSKNRLIGYGDNFLTVRAIKKYIDGALGSHGAWLLEPYEDMPTSAGLNVETIETLTESARLAIENNFQLCIHAIGDRGNREVLDIYEQAFASHPDLKNLRWRIEHAQHLDLADIPRFAKLGVIASMQGIHATSDGPWVPKRIGDTRSEQGAYVWRKLIESGAHFCNGTDAPVEDVNPLENFYALVTRMLPGGSQFYPDQCLTREEALAACTINAAYAAFEEDIKGSLTVGKLADITVLSADIMTIPAGDIPNVSPIYTIVGGQISYQSDKIESD